MEKKQMTSGHWSSKQVSTRSSTEHAKDFPPSKIPKLSSTTHRTSYQTSESSREIRQLVTTTTQVVSTQEQRQVETLKKSESAKSFFSESEEEEWLVSEWSEDQSNWNLSAKLKLKDGIHRHRQKRTIVNEFGREVECDSSDSDEHDTSGNDTLIAFESRETQTANNSAETKDFSFYSPDTTGDDSFTFDQNKSVSNSDTKSFNVDETLTKKEVVTVTSEFSQSTTIKESGHGKGDDASSKSDKVAGISQSVDEQIKQIQQDVAEDGHQPAIDQGEGQKTTSETKEGVDICVAETSFITEKEGRVMFEIHQNVREPEFTEEMRSDISQKFSDQTSSCTTGISITKTSSSVETITSSETSRKEATEGSRDIPVVETCLDPSVDNFIEMSKGGNTSTIQGIEKEYASTIEESPPTIERMANELGENVMQQLAQNESIGGRDSNEPDMSYEGVSRSHEYTSITGESLKTTVQTTQITKSSSFQESIHETRSEIQVESQSQSSLIQNKSQSVDEHEGSNSVINASEEVSKDIRESSVMDEESTNDADAVERTTLESSMQQNTMVITDTSSVASTGESTYDEVRRSQDQAQLGTESTTNHPTVTENTNSTYVSKQDDTKQQLSTEAPYVRDAVAEDGEAVVEQVEIGGEDTSYQAGVIQVCKTATGEAEQKDTMQQLSAGATTNAEDVAECREVNMEYSHGQMQIGRESTSYQTTVSTNIYKTQEDATQSTAADISDAIEEPFTQIGDGLEDVVNGDIERMEIDGVDIGDQTTYIGTERSVTEQEDAIQHVCTDTSNNKEEEVESGENVEAQLKQIQMGAECISSITTATKVTRTVEISNSELKENDVFEHDVIKEADLKYTVQQLSTVVPDDAEDASSLTTVTKITKTVEISNSESSENNVLLKGEGKLETKSDDCTNVDDLESEQRLSEGAADSTQGSMGNDNLKTATEAVENIGKPSSKTATPEEEIISDVKEISETVHNLIDVLNDKQQSLSEHAQEKQTIDGDDNNGTVHEIKIDLSDESGDNVDLCISQMEVEKAAIEGTQIEERSDIYFGSDDKSLDTHFKIGGDPDNDVIIETRSTGAKETNEQESMEIDEAIRRQNIESQTIYANVDHDKLDNTETIYKQEEEKMQPIDFSEEDVDINNKEYVPTESEVDITDCMGTGNVDTENALSEQTEIERENDFERVNGSPEQMQVAPPQTKNGDEGFVEYQECETQTQDTLSTGSVKEVREVSRVDERHAIEQTTAYTTDSDIAIEQNVTQKEDSSDQLGEIAEHSEMQRPTSEMVEHKNDLPSDDNIEIEQASGTSDMMEKIQTKVGETTDGQQIMEYECESTEAIEAAQICADMTAEVESPQQGAVEHIPESHKPSESDPAVVIGEQVEEAEEVQDLDADDVSVNSALVRETQTTQVGTASDKKADQGDDIANVDDVVEEIGNTQQKREKVTEREDGLANAEIEGYITEITEKMEEAQDAENKMIEHENGARHEDVDRYDIQSTKLSLGHQSQETELVIQEEEPRQIDVLEDLEGIQYEQRQDRGTLAQEDVTRHGYDTPRDNESKELIQDWKATQSQNAKMIALEESKRQAHATDAQRECSEETQDDQSLEKETLTHDDATRQEDDTPQDNDYTKYIQGVDTTHIEVAGQEVMEREDNLNQRSDAAQGDQINAHEMADHEEVGRQHVFVTHGIESSEPKPDAQIPESEVIIQEEVVAQEIAAEEECEVSYQFVQETSLITKQAITVESEQVDMIPEDVEQATDDKDEGTTVKDNVVLDISDAPSYYETYVASKRDRGYLPTAKHDSNQGSSKNFRERFKIRKASERISLEESKPIYIFVLQFDDNEKSTKEINDMVKEYLCRKAEVEESPCNVAIRGSAQSFGTWRKPKQAVQIEKGWHALLINDIIPKYSQYKWLDMSASVAEGNQDPTTGFIYEPAPFVDRVCEFNECKAGQEVAIVCNKWADYSFTINYTNIDEWNLKELSTLNTGYPTESSSTRDDSILSESEADDIVKAKENKTEISSQGVRSGVEYEITDQRTQITECSVPEGHHEVNVDTHSQIPISPHGKRELDAFLEEEVISKKAKIEPGVGDALGRQEDEVVSKRAKLDDVADTKQFENHGDEVVSEKTQIDSEVDIKREENQEDDAGSISSQRNDDIDNDQDVIHGDAEADKEVYDQDIRNDDDKATDKSMQESFWQFLNIPTPDKTSSPKIQDGGRHSTPNEKQRDNKLAPRSLNNDLDGLESTDLHVTQKRDSVASYTNEKSGKNQTEVAQYMTIDEGVISEEHADESLLEKAKDFFNIPGFSKIEKEGKADTGEISLQDRSKKSKDTLAVDDEVGIQYEETNFTEMSRTEYSSKKISTMTLDQVQTTNVSIASQSKTSKISIQETEKSSSSTKIENLMNVFHTPDSEKADTSFGTDDELKEGDMAPSSKHEEVREQLQESHVDNKEPQEGTFLSKLKGLFQTTATRTSDDETQVNVAENKGDESIQGTSGHETATRGLLKTSSVEGHVTEATPGKGKEDAEEERTREKENTEDGNTDRMRIFFSIPDNKSREFAMHDQETDVLETKTEDNESKATADEQAKPEVYERDKDTLTNEGDKSTEEHESKLDIGERIKAFFRPSNLTETDGDKESPNTQHETVKNKVQKPEDEPSAGEQAMLADKGQDTLEPGGIEAICEEPITQEDDTGLRSLHETPQLGEQMGKHDDMSAYQANQQTDETESKSKDTEKDETAPNLGEKIKAFFQIKKEDTDSAMEEPDEIKSALTHETQSDVDSSSKPGIGDKIKTFFNVQPLDSSENDDRGYDTLDSDGTRVIHGEPIMQTDTTGSIKEKSRLEEQKENDDTSTNKTKQTDESDLKSKDIEHNEDEEAVPLGDKIKAFFQIKKDDADGAKEEDGETKPFSAKIEDETRSDVDSTLQPGIGDKIKTFFNVQPLDTTEYHGVEEQIRHENYDRALGALDSNGACLIQEEQIVQEGATGLSSLKEIPPLEEQMEKDGISIEQANQQTGKTEEDVGNDEDEHAPQLGEKIKAFLQINKEETLATEEETNETGNASTGNEDETRTDIDSSHQQSFGEKLKTFFNVQPIDTTTVETRVDHENDDKGHCTLGTGGTNAIHEEPIMQENATVIRSTNETQWLKEQIQNDADMSADQANQKTDETDSKSEDSKHDEFEKATQLGEKIKAFFQIKKEDPGMTKEESGEIKPASAEQEDEMKSDIDSSSQPGIGDKIKTFFNVQPSNTNLDHDDKEDIQNKNGDNKIDTTEQDETNVINEEPMVNEDATNVLSANETPQLGEKIKAFFQINKNPEETKEGNDDMKQTEETSLPISDEQHKTDDSNEKEETGPQLGQKIKAFFQIKKEEQDEMPQAEVDLQKDQAKPTADNFGNYDDHHDHDNSSHHFGDKIKAFFTINRDTTEEIPDEQRNISKDESEAKAEDFKEDDNETPQLSDKIKAFFQIKTEESVDNSSNQTGIPPTDLEPKPEVNDKGEKEPKLGEKIKALFQIKQEEPNAEMGENGETRPVDNENEAMQDVEPSVKINIGEKIKTFFNVQPLDTTLEPGVEDQVQAQDDKDPGSTDQHKTQATQEEQVFPKDAVGLHSTKETETVDSATFADKIRNFLNVPAEDITNTTSSDDGIARQSTEPKQRYDSSQYIEEPSSKLEAFFNLPHEEGKEQNAQITSVDTQVETEELHNELHNNSAPGPNVDTNDQDLIVVKTQEGPVTDECEKQEVIPDDEPECEGELKTDGENQEIIMVSPTITLNSSEEKGVTSAMVSTEQHDTTNASDELVSATETESEYIPNDATNSTDNLILPADDNVTMSNLEVIEIDQHPNYEESAYQKTEVLPESLNLLDTQPNGTETPQEEHVDFLSHTEDSAEQAQRETHVIQEVMIRTASFPTNAVGNKEDENVDDDDLNVYQETLNEHLGAIEVESDITTTQISVNAGNASTSEIESDIGITQSVEHCSTGSMHEQMKDSTATVNTDEDISQQKDVQHLGTAHGIVEEATQFLNIQTLKTQAEDESNDNQGGQTQDVQDTITSQDITNNPDRANIDETGDNLQPDPTKSENGNGSGLKEFSSNVKAIFTGGKTTGKDEDGTEESNQEHVYSQEVASDDTAKETSQYQSVPSKIKGLFHPKPKGEADTAQGVETINIDLNHDLESETTHVEDSTVEGKSTQDTSQTIPEKIKAFFNIHSTDEKDPENEPENEKDDPTSQHVDNGLERELSHTDDNTSNSMTGVTANGDATQTIPEKIKAFFNIQSHEPKEKDNQIDIENEINETPSQLDKHIEDMDDKEDDKANTEEDSDRKATTIKEKIKTLFTLGQDKTGNSNIDTPEDDTSENIHDDLTPQTGDGANEPEKEVGIPNQASSSEENGISMLIEHFWNIPKIEETIPTIDNEEIEDINEGEKGETDTLQMEGEIQDSEDIRDEFEQQVQKSPSYYEKYFATRTRTSTQEDQTNQKSQEQDQVDRDKLGRNGDNKEEATGINLQVDTETPQGIKGQGSIGSFFNIPQVEPDTTDLDAKQDEHEDDNLSTNNTKQTDHDLENSGNKEQTFVDKFTSLFKGEGATPQAKSDDNGSTTKEHNADGNFDKVPDMGSKEYKAGPTEEKSMSRNNEENIVEANTDDFSTTDDTSKEKVPFVTKVKHFFSIEEKFEDKNKDLQTRSDEEASLERANKSEKETSDGVTFTERMKNMFAIPTSHANEDASNVDGDVTEKTFSQGQEPSRQEVQRTTRDKNLSDKAESDADSPYKAETESVPFTTKVKEFFSVEKEIQQESTTQTDSIVKHDVVENPEVTGISFAEKMKSIFVIPPIQETGETSTLDGVQQEHQQYSEERSDRQNDQQTCTEGDQGELEMPSEIDKRPEDKVRSFFNIPQKDNVDGTSGISDQSNEEPKQTGIEHDDIEEGTLDESTNITFIEKFKQYFNTKESGETGEHQDEITDDMGAIEDQQSDEPKTYDLEKEHDVAQKAVNDEGDTEHEINENDSQRQAEAEEKGDTISENMDYSTDNDDIIGEDVAIREDLVDKTSVKQKSKIPRRIGTSPKQNRGPSFFTGVASIEPHGFDFSFTPRAQAVAICKESKTVAEGDEIEDDEINIDPTSAENKEQSQEDCDTKDENIQTTEEIRVCDEVGEEIVAQQQDLNLSEAPATLEASTTGVHSMTENDVNVAAGVQEDKSMTSQMEENHFAPESQTELEEKLEDMAGKEVDVEQDNGTVTQELHSTNITMITHQSQTTTTNVTTTETVEITSKVNTRVEEVEKTMMQKMFEKFLTVRLAKDDINDDTSSQALSENNNPIDTTKERDFDKLSSDTKLPNEATEFWRIFFNIPKLPAVTIINEDPSATEIKGTSL